MADRMTAITDGELVGLKVAAGALIETGKMAALNASGYAVPGADAANLKVAGMAEETIDNTSGSDGELTVLVRRKKAFLFANDSANAVTQAHVFTNVYVKDAWTVSSSGGANNIVAGRCIGIEPDGVWVEI